MPVASKVLKAGSAAAEAEKTYNFIDLRQRCDDYADRIRQQCRNWVIEAQNEAGAIRQAAYDEGRRDGLKEGLADAAGQIEKQATAQSTAAISQALATAIPALEAAVAAVQAEREAWAARWERDAIGLALAIAERLTHKALADDGDVLHARVAETIALAGGEKTVTVHLHPRDLAATQELKSQPAGVTFVGDNDLAPGDVVAMTGEGLIDARLETQLETIRVALEEA